ncbi:MAG: hypothetical protein OJJ21_17095 [Ferrovibrio sp.]|uniref:hypothetical protein n=1 Tax=Ferrovibrio sp. TaxID=1917215 RepID=UPI00262D7085|nr:hypothetical protein [Ferrovibrio sp.]MCW0235318.1 hypothetical protein [Ferrovibrio sp.]
MQRSSILLAMAFALVAAASAWAQGQAPGRDRAARSNTACFNQKEAEAEAEVRTGIQIREILRRCAQIDPGGQAYLDDWYLFDQENGDRLRAAVELRRTALGRIFPNRGQAQQWETDATVATMKPLQTNEAVCKSTYDIMERLKKEQWKGFKYYARLQENILVYELPLCRK